MSVLKVFPDPKMDGFNMQRSSIDLLPEGVRADLDKRLVQGGFSDYQGLSDWLGENGFKIGKSSVHRYGSKLEEKFEAIAASTQAAKSLIAASPDDDSSVNEAVLRLVQEQLFNLMMDSTGALEPKDLSAIARAVADVTRGSISNKKYRAEVKAKSELAAKEIDIKVRSAGLDEATAAEIRQKILGIAA